jgi:CRP-like cAMP-binding protein
MITIMSKSFAKQLIERAQKHRTLKKGTFLFHKGDPVNCVFVIDKGLVELTRPQIDGTSITMQRATAQTVLAEASVYSDIYHCDACAAMPSTVFQLSKTEFLSHLSKDPPFSILWSAHLAREVQSARYRSEILSSKTVAQRLDGWLSWYKNELPDKGQWKSVAEQIGVSPEALYRELAKRRTP